MPNLPLQIIQICTDFLILIFFIYYFLHLRAKEQDLNRREGKLDTDYHQVVEGALSKERKILEDAAREADQIIADSRFVSKSVKDEVGNALQSMVVDVQNEAIDTARTFTANYQLSLQQLATQSMGDFRNILKGLQDDLQRQVVEFRQSLLPALEKDLQEYKKTRLKETDRMVISIVQKSAQEILNKSLSLEDHQTLVLDSLEKAKKNGVFD